jgi:hypothetical protein
MSQPETPPGFARLIAAVKGVGSLIDWMSEPPKGEAPKLPGGSHCTQRPPRGFRCLVRGEHERCVLEKVR